MALGSVSIPPFTRAEFKNAIKKAMYSEGKLVYTARATFSYKSSEILTLPATVDYVKLSGGSYDSWVQDSYHVPEGTKADQRKLLPHQYGQLLRQNHLQ